MMTMMVMVMVVVGKNVYRGVTWLSRDSTGSDVRLIGRGGGNTKAGDAWPLYGLYWPYPGLNMRLHIAAEIQCISNYMDIAHLRLCDFLTVGVIPKHSEAKLKQHWNQPTPSSFNIRRKTSITPTGRLVRIGACLVPVNVRTNTCSWRKTCSCTILFSQYIWYYET